MKAISKSLFLLTLILAVSWLAGCSKPSVNNSIYNAWTYTGYVGGYTYVDTPIRYTPISTGTGASLQLNSNSTFNYTGTVNTFPLFTADSNKNISGTFYYSHDTLIMYDSRYPNGPVNTKVVALNTSAMTLLRTDRDSIFSGGPVDYFEVVYYFSR